MGLIWGSIWLFYPHGEGGGRGNFEFCGMVEAVRVLVVLVVVVCQGERLQPYKMQGCNLISMATVKGYLFTCFVVV